MTAGSSLASIEWAVCWYDETNEEQIDEVKDGDSPDNLSSSFGDLFSGILSFSGCQSGKFGTAVGKRGCHKD